MRWLLLLLLCVPLSSSAAVLRICNMGDTQRGAQCSNETTAWAHLDASIDWIVANPSMCDVVLFPGDLVDGYGWAKYGDMINWFDCWCLAQGTPSIDCTEYENPRTERTCYSTECDNTEASACAGGTAGHYCEQTRIRGLLDKLSGAGVPYITLPGNHDTQDPRIQPACAEGFEDYNTYFGKGKMSGGFSETGVLETTLPCAGVDIEQGDASYHVLTQSNGAQWLFLATPWQPGRPNNSPNAGNQYDSGISNPGMSDEILAWMLGVIDAHPGMPTIPISHAVVSNDCDDAYAADYEDIWCAPWLGTLWDDTATGKPIYDHMMSIPQVFMTIGSHIRELFYAVSASTKHRVLGVAADYTNVVPGAPSWQSTDGPVNGGGGVVTLWVVDPVNGVISSKAYSDQAYLDGDTGWVGVYGDEGSNWAVQMPLCGDNTRFDFPAAACPERVFTPSVNLGSIRKR